MNDVREGQEFHEAQVVDISTGDGYWQIAFADHRVTPSAYLLLQNAFAYDPSDRESGMDSHYVELNDQSQSVYGGGRASDSLAGSIASGVDSDWEGELGDFGEFWTEVRYFRR